MPISFVPARDTTAQYAVFGKLPERADFIRLGLSNHPAVVEFDGVLARSLGTVSRQPGWNEADALQAGISDFLFTTYERRWCYFGVLHPSFDKAGRMFPLVAGIVLPAHAVTAASAEFPLANELFFSGLRETLASVIKSGDLQPCQRFLDSWAAPSPHARDNIELAGQLLARHLADTPLARLHVTLNGDSFPALDDILLAFIFYADMLRRAGTGAQKKVIALPLSENEGEAVLDQAMWMAFFRAAMGKNKTCFPDYIARNDGRRTLTLAPGRLGERCLGALWGMANDPVAMLDAGETNAPWLWEPAWGFTAYALGREVQDPNTHLASLLSTVERITGNVS
ncbi:MAG: type VI secretion system-associated protein TagF [Azoarcus sp.]|jgi:type VI secretion system protein ImpM|nr:type VI secretion system-associated protein TagF [Azoarcus sp.]